MWRGSGVVFVVLTIVAFFIYGSQPKLGASPA
jgi:Na+-transporting methylmalonyl-CoA/oxaloacetate decarboxylase gamma subunit